MRPSSNDFERPWEMPFWKSSKGKGGVLPYFIFLHVLAIIGLFLYPIPSIPVLAVTMVVAAMGGLGTTICFHRSLAHRAVRLNKVVEQTFIFSTVLNASGSPMSWAANHRRHHAHSDSEQDVSSPVHGGFWWAHLRWLYQTPRADIRRWCPDICTRTNRFWAFAAVPLAAIGLFIGLLWSWEAFFWLGAIRLVYSLHGQCIVNSVMHMGQHRDGGEDSSQNVWWLGPLQFAAWGENWHRNHHSQPNSARFGRHWWQVDLGWYAIIALEWMGLADRVKRPDVSLDIEPSLRPTPSPSSNR